MGRPLAAAVLVFLPVTALAQRMPFGKPTASPSPTVASEAAAEVAPDSPRASLAAYLDLARAGRYGEAARYLSFRRARRAARRRWPAG